MQNRDDTPAHALWCAAHQGDVSVLSRLIAEGVDVNTWDRRGRNALTFAASSGQFAAVKTLVEAGAWIDPFEDGNLFMSPLMCAAYHGQLETAEFLLDRGADPTLQGGINSCTAEYYARQGNHEYLAAILRRAEDQLRRARSNPSEPNQRSALDLT